MRSSAILLLTAAILPASVLHSQIIPLKTVPLAQGQQFLIHPSENTVIGGAMIALDDSLADPYRNPAAGAMVRGLRVSLSPLYYGIDLGARAQGTTGMTYPASILLGGERMFGGFSWASQSLTTGIGQAPFATVVGPFSPTPRETHSNKYVFGLFGLNFPAAGVSAGLSAFRADLNALDGVQYLYPAWNGLTQRGSISTYRLGMRGAWEGDRVLDVVVAHQRTDIRHMMLADPPMWIPFDPVIPIPPSIRTEEDETFSNGFHIGYRQPLNETWIVGGMLAGTMKSHPKIPNYGRTSILFDPGTSRAWNLGIGLSTRGVSTVFAVDAVYEPVTSETWSEYVPPPYVDPAPILLSGQRAVENFFDFSNYHIRFGIRSRVRDLGVGLHIHRVAYDLKQINHLGRSIRHQSEAWTEVTLSVGFGFDLFGGHVKYLGLADFGTGRPDLDTAPVYTTTSAYDTAGDFLVAPQGPMRLDEATIFTHQISFTLTFP